VRLSRRALLRGSVLALGVGPTDALGLPGQHVLDGVPRLVADTGARPTPARLTESDLDDLIAFAELLAKGGALSPAERSALAENIAERVAREPDYLDLYRRTATLLRRLAGRPFASLEVADRLELVARHRLSSPAVRPGDDPGPFADDLRAVRMRARPALMADYYNSPAGWAVVGYDVFPGRCGDLLRYTRPET